MEFSINKKKLTNLLYLTTSIVEKRNTMPILANVKIIADNNLVSIFATDLEINLVGHIDSEVRESGEITVNAKMLYEIVKELSDEDENVVLSLKNKARMEIESGSSDFKIVCMSSDEFPEIKGVDLNNQISIKSDKFLDMLNKTEFSISDDETRFSITGVYIRNIEEEGESLLRFVSTDGHRISVVDRTSDGVNLDKGVIIPKKGVHQLQKLLESREEEAIIGIDGSFLTVQCDNVTVGVRLIDGEYPDYMNIFPKSTITKVVLDRSKFISTLKRVSLLSTDKSKTVRLYIEDGEVSVLSSSPEYGEGIEIIEGEQEGENLSIGFSANYIIDILNSMSEHDKVTLSLNGDNRGGVFFSELDPKYRCLVMPIRFGEKEEEDEED